MRMAWSWQTEMSESIDLCQGYTDWTFEHRSLAVCLPACVPVTIIKKHLFAGGLILVSLLSMTHPHAAPMSA